MSIRYLLSAFCLCVAFGCHGPSSAPPAETASSERAALYSDEVNIKPTSGKGLVMKFEEIERRDGLSAVKVKCEEGASVPSVMFIVKGMCEIARMRGAKYFVNLKEWENEDGNWMYLVAFTSTKDVDLKALYGADCAKEIDENAFMSVEDYSFLLGPEDASARP